MPPPKKKRPPTKKKEKKSRASSTKKKKVEDKPWKTSFKVKVETKGTPEDSPHSTPTCSEYENKQSRNSSMTSRDFIRQVLQFDKASDSELESQSDNEEDSDETNQSSDTELKMAIQDSLASKRDEYRDSDDDCVKTSDIGEDGTPDVSLVVSGSGVVGDVDADSLVTDSNTSFPAGSVAHDDIFIQSVYAPMPEIIPDDMPSLKLPVSSDDLLVTKDYVLRAVGVYEILRMFSQIIRLSPFIFEEFLAAIGVSKTFEYNPLLHEVHSCLIKTLLREEDNNQTSFGPVDVKDSMNSLFFFNDAMTYSHVIREYFRSDSDSEFKKVLSYISKPEYPNATVDDVLAVLETLCNLFLASNIVREELNADGFIHHDEYCRVCQRGGDVVCCENCPGVYHLFCVDPPLEEIPAGDWICNVCLDSEVHGVSDCKNSRETNVMNRNDPIGFDRHWRKYWFVVRRIIIEGEDGEICYVSTEKQFEELMNCLDGEKWEKQLVHNLNQRKEEIIEHMNITQQLTDERKGQRISALSLENKRIDKLREECEKRKTSEISVNLPAEQRNDVPKDDTEDTKGSIITAAVTSSVQDTAIVDNSAASKTEVASSTAATAIPEVASGTVTTGIFSLDIADNELSDITSNHVSKSVDIITSSTNDDEITNLPISVSFLENSPVPDTIPSQKLIKEDGTCADENPSENKCTIENTGEYLLADNAGEHLVIDNTQKLLILNNAGETLTIDSAEQSLKNVVDKPEEPIARDNTRESFNKNNAKESSAIINAREFLTIDNSTEESLAIENTGDSLFINNVGESKSQIANPSSRVGNELEKNDEDLWEKVSALDEKPRDTEEESRSSNDDLGEEGMYLPAKEEELGTGGESFGEEELGTGENFGEEEEGSEGEDLEEEEALGDESDLQEDYDEEMGDDEEDEFLEDGEVANVDIVQQLGDLGDSDDGAIMDSEDGDDMDSSDELLDESNDFLGLIDHSDDEDYNEDEDSDPGESSDMMEFDQQLDGAVDSEQEDKDNAAVKNSVPSQQHIIIQAPPAMQNQSSDASAAKTPVNPSIKYVAMANCGNRGKPAMPKQYIRTVNTANNIITLSPTNTVRLISPKPANTSANSSTIQSSLALSGSAGTIVKNTKPLPSVTVLATAQSGKTVSTNSAPVKVNAVSNRQVINVDKFGNIVSVSSPSAALSPNLLNIQKTYGKKVVATGGTKVFTAAPTIVKTQDGQPGVSQTPATSVQAPVTQQNSDRISAMVDSNAQPPTIQIFKGTKPMLKILRDAETLGESPKGSAVQLPPTGLRRQLETIKTHVVQGPIPRFISPVVTTASSGMQRGNVLKIITDKSLKTSATGITAVSSSAVHAGQPTLNTARGSSGYRLIRSQGQPQKIVLGTGTDNKTVLKTSDGKIISLQSITQSFPIHSQQTITTSSVPGGTIVQMVRGGVTSTPLVVNPMSRAVSQHGKIITTPMVTKRIALPPRAPTQIRPKLISSRKQTVVLMETDGSQTTVQVDPDTLQTKTPQLLGIKRRAAKPETPELIAVKELDGTTKYVTRASTGKLAPKTFTDSVTDKKGSLRMITSFKAEQEMKQKRQKLDEKIAKVLSSKTSTEEPVTKPAVNIVPYKLGMDGVHKSYVNQYSENPYALSKNQQQEEKDKKRQLSYKFSLTSASDFRWHGKVYGTPLVLMETVKSTIKQFEEVIPLCFMHPHWPTLRTLWLKALNTCTTINRFITVLGLFQVNVKPVLFNAVWNESLGHFSMIRQTAKDKEDLRKREKVEKRQQDLLEQNPIQQAKYTSVKYTKVLKHQIHKLKGEEYRLSDANGGGWIWVKASRKIKSVAPEILGLRACSRIGDIDSEVLLSNVRHSVTADVSKGLRCRDIYPRYRTPKSKLNALLNQRMMLEKCNLEKKETEKSQADTSNKSESSSLASKNVPVTVSSVEKPSPDQSDNALKDESMEVDDSADVEEPMESTEREKSCQPEGSKGSPSCYSPLCRAYAKEGRKSSLHACYSHFCPNKINSTIAKEDNKIPSSAASRSYNSKNSIFSSAAIVKSTKDKVDLMDLFNAKRKSDSINIPKIRKAILCRPHRYRTRSGKSCPFVLPKEELGSLARSGGRLEVAGFNYACKNAPGYWPYPCSRPRFRIGWEYRLNTGVTSIHGIASLLRVLWACVRWDDMNTKPPAGGASVSTNESDITTREIMEKRDIGPTKLQSQYKVRTIIIPFNFLEQPTKVDTSEPIREGLRKRKKHQMKQPAQPSTSVVWVPEEQLELWEISAFSERTALHKIEKQDKSSIKKAKKLAPKAANTEAVSDGANLTVQQKPRDTAEVSQVKAEFEEQLKKQRAYAQANRRGIVASAPLKLEPLAPVSKTLTIAPSIASMLAAGTPIMSPPGSSLTIKGPNGKDIQIKGLRPDQQLLRLPNGKITIVPKETFLNLKKMRATKGAVSLAVASVSSAATTTTTSATTSTVTVTAADAIASAVKTDLAIAATKIVASSATAPAALPVATTTTSTSSNVIVSAVKPVTVTVTLGSLLGVSSKPIVTAAASASEVKTLTPAGIQASLLKAQSLPPVEPTKSLLVKQVELDDDQHNEKNTKPQLNTSQESVDVERDDTKSGNDEDEAEENANHGDGKADNADDEAGTTLSTMVVQQVVARALSSTQAPEIQSRLQEMQKKLATVQGTITVTNQKPKSPERLVSEYHEEMKSKPIKQTNMFEPRVPTEEELESARLRKIKNKEDYKKRKEKDRVKKLSMILEKHKALLKKELKLKKDMLDYRLRREIRDEIFMETGAVISIEARKPESKPQLKPVTTAYSTIRTSSTAKTSSGNLRYKSIKKEPSIKSEISSSNTQSPASTPNPVRSARPSTSKYAKKRKISLSSPDQQQDDSKSASATPPAVKKAYKPITKPKPLQNKLYCVCQTPLDKSKFYVGCDICAQWFHGSCVGISEDDDSINSFTCDTCKQHQQQCCEELYCLCNKPYNDAQFYVGCDECEGWFHPGCVGITQEEAEASDTYLCPTCASKGSQSSNHDLPIKGSTMTSLRKLIKSLQAVDPEKVPDYYEVVTSPMDLATLKTKLRAETYKTVGDFAKDATKIFNNARYYNTRDSPIFLCAEKLEKYFVQQLKDIKGSSNMHKL